MYADDHYKSEMKKMQVMKYHRPMKRKNECVVEEKFAIVFSTTISLFDQHILVSNSPSFLIYHHHSIF